MAPTIQTGEPREFVAGDSVYFNITDSTYPPSEGWSLSYAFDGPTPFELNQTQSPPPIQVDSSSDSFQVRIPTSTTQGLEAGTYTWYRYATKGPERYRTRSGSVVVRPDKVAAGPTQTKAEQELALYITARDAILGGTVKAYQIQGRAFTKLDLQYLEKKIGYLRSQVSRERAAAQNGGATFGRKIAVKFNAPRY